MDEVAVWSGTRKVRFGIQSQVAESDCNRRRIAPGPADITIPAAAGQELRFYFVVFF